MLAAIEIYNKPQMPYRDECFTILLVNAWELLAKAILSKNRQRIFQKKVRGKPYQTHTFWESLRMVKSFFPDDIAFRPVLENLTCLVEYRNNTIHFYNDPGFRLAIYGFAQTCIVNYRDLVFAIFGQDITIEITFTLLPLGFGSAPDPIAFLREKNTKPSHNRFVTDYLHRIVDITRSLEEQDLDTGRFLRKFDVSLQSTKKISSADLVVGIASSTAGNQPTVVVEKRVDPNISHPLKRKEI